MTVIEIRPHRWGWKAFEAPGVEPLCPEEGPAPLLYLSIMRESSTYCRGSGKNLLDYVIRRFNLSSARLNKPQGLDLR